jgi:uncharacterized membrane protein
VVAKYAGRAITDKVGDWWVKAIDYAYLGLSFFGLLRIVFQSIEENTQARDLQTVIIVSVLIVAIGVALRITKTSIEIFHWAAP